MISRVKLGKLCRCITSRVSRTDVVCTSEMPCMFKWYRVRNARRNPRLACSWNPQGSSEATKVEALEAQAATTRERRSIIQISISAPDGAGCGRYKSEDRSPI
jgi:hypothetical protein